MKFLRSLLATLTGGGQKDKPLNEGFPFQTDVVDGSYDIVAQIESDALYPRYFDLFQKHGYEGNGYCWEGHVIQILEKVDKDPIAYG